MSATDRLLANNERYAASFPGPPPERTPDVAVVACMDARLDIYRILGLGAGEAGGAEGGGEKERECGEKQAGAAGGGVG